MRAMTSRSCIKHSCLYERNTKKFRNVSGKVRTGDKVKVCWVLPRAKWSISLANSHRIDCTLSIVSTPSSKEKADVIPVTPSVLWNKAKSWSRMQLVTITGIVACSFLVIPSAHATDALKTCSCLLKECRQTHLMRSMTSRSCIKHACLYERNTEKFRARDKVKVCCVLPREKWSISLANSHRIDCTLSIVSTPSSKEKADIIPVTPSVLWNNAKSWSRMQLVTITGIVACSFLVIPSAHATDALKTCTCLLKECRIELAKCIANPSCAANVACLQTCNNRPDETECQIKCGDLFENSVVDQFNECAVSQKKCVPRKSDLGEFPEPDPGALVRSFNLSDFTGKWYISSGLNPTFDTFDCQAHEFKVEGDKLVGNLTWRIRTPDTGFFTRSAVQKFAQDPSRPGILYNHDNEYLHYQDDWYIISSKVESKPDDYIFVYYRGRNDAWDGYGGAVLYTRNRTVPATVIPELERAAKSINRDFSQFIRTDNTCGPEPPLVERIEKTVEEGEKSIVREVEEIEGEVIQFEKTELTLLQKLAEGFNEVERDAENFLSKEEMEVLDGLKMEAIEVEKLFGRALPIRKLR